jgi:PAS domain S-box-containing protein
MAMTARDGRQRIVGYAPPGAGSNGLAIAVGLDRKATFAAVTDANRIGLIMILAVVTLALATTLVAGKFLIRRPFQRLLDVADRWRTGDLAARTGLRADGSEFGRLAAAFDAMAAAQEARERALRLALDGSSAGMWRLDMHSRQVSLDARSRDIFGCGSGDLEACLSHVHEDDRDRISARLDEMLRTPGDETWDMAFRAMQPGGAVRWVHALGQAERAADGSLSSLTGINLDITQHKLAEGELAHAHALLRSVGYCSPDPIYAKDVAGRFLFANPAALAVFGKQAEQVIGHCEWHDDPARAARAIANDQRIIASGGTEVVEETLNVEGQGERVFLSAKAPLRMGDGTVCGLVGVLSDITRIKETETALRQEIAAKEAALNRAAHGERMQALGRLAGGIAHDFNNVLQAVAGAASLAGHHPGDEAGVLRFARLGLEAVDRGASITQRLLAFAHRADLRAEALDPSALLRNIGEILVHTLGAAIGVKVGPEAALPPLLADKGQLETALINLATNAADAMPQGGRLSLLAETDIVSADGAPHPAGLAQGRYIRLTVADTGMGMDAATLARATEPFFTTKGVGIGTGLGLPMARGFAEQSGGALRIESSPGAGTIVTLWLPEARSAERPVSARPLGTVAATIRATDKVKVHARLLLVDDENDIRETLAETLELAGHSVLIAESGTAALALLAAGEEVDVLLTDLSMPGMDGVSLIREAQKHCPELIALLLTGYAGDDAARSGIVEGTFSLLRKPVGAIDLIDRIDALLEARSKTQSYTSPR